MVTFEKMLPQEREICAALAARAFNDYEYFTDYVPDDKKQIYVPSECLELGVMQMQRRDAAFRIYDRERLLIELLRYKNKLPFDYYKEILGKRVFVVITDGTGDAIESKIDLGVHKNLSVEQEEYCFDLACFEEGANLLINSPEQMFTEKLRSLLKFGALSTRYKDIFDMCYLSERVDPAKLRAYMDTYIFSDPGMRENTMEKLSLLSSPS